MNEGRQDVVNRANDLYRIGRAIADGEHFGVWNKILEHIVHDFKATSASAALIDNDKGELTMIGGVGHPIDLVGKTIKLGEGVIGWVASNGRPVLLNHDPASDQRFDNVAQRQHKPSSAICWPLTVEQQVIGVLCINRHGPSERYTEVDMEQGSTLIDVVSVVIDNARLHVEREHRIRMLSDEKEAQQKLVAELRAAQEQILRCDRMASIGQLAAGVAHEINNPIAYVSSNMRSLGHHMQNLLKLLSEYEAMEPHCENASLARLEELKSSLNLPSLKTDVSDILDETCEGVDRVRGIVADLKTFCHVGGAPERIDLHDSIDSTLNIVAHQLKYRVEIVREYGEIPLVECVVSELNQVIMNLLVNAGQAIEGDGTITISTRAHDDDWVTIAFTDTGPGVASENIHRIFEPLFTTKQRGDGSGLGLSVCASIVEKHGGRIEVSTELGRGATFTVWLPAKVRADASEDGGEAEAEEKVTSLRE